MSLSFKATKQTGMKQENISILPSSTVTPSDSRPNQSHSADAATAHNRSHAKVPEHEAPLSNQRSGGAHPARAAERGVKRSFQQARNIPTLNDHRINPPRWERSASDSHPPSPPQPRPAGDGQEHREEERVEDTHLTGRRDGEH